MRIGSLEINPWVCENLSFSVWKKKWDTGIICYPLVEGNTFDITYQKIL